MGELVAHRGPDGAGSFLSPDGEVGLAHRRLAIIDLSPTGSQPMTDAVTGVTIAYNGEIYNYRKLRAAGNVRRGVRRALRHRGDPALVSGTRARDGTE